MVPSSGIATLRQLRARFSSLERDQHEAAYALSQLDHPRLAHAMAHGAHRDRRARCRLESFILDRDGRLTPLPERAAPLTATATSAQGLVAASVVRTRRLQSDLHAAAELATFPKRLRRWMHQQIISLEARNARMQRILTGGAPALLRRRRKRRAPASDPSRRPGLLAALRGSLPFWNASFVAVLAVAAWETYSLL